MKINMKTRCVTLSDSHIRKVTEKAQKYSVNFSDMLRRMIDDYCEVEENDQIGKNRNLEEKSSQN